MTDHSPQELFLWRLFLLFISLGMASACGALDFSLRHDHFTSVSTKDSELGTIYFHYANEPEPYIFHATRLKHSGYALQATLDENGSTSRTNLVASHTKEYKNFVGIESHYAF